MSTVACTGRNAFVTVTTCPLSAGWYGAVHYEPLVPPPSPFHWAFLLSWCFLLPSALLFHGAHCFEVHSFDSIEGSWTPGVTFFRVPLPPRSDMAFLKQLFASALLAISSSHSIPLVLIWNALLMFSFALDSLTRVKAGNTP